MPPFIPRIRKGVCPIRVTLIDRIAVAKPVQVRPARIPNRIAVDELARPWIIIPVRQAQKARLRVRVVPELASEPCGVMLPNARSRRAFVGLPECPVALKGGAVVRRQTRRERRVRLTLLHAPLRIVHELVDQAPLLAGTPAICRDPVEGGECCRSAVEALLGNGSAPVVDVVGGHAPRRLLGPQTIPVVSRAERGAADRGQAIFRVEAEGSTFVGGRVAVAVEDVQTQVDLVVGVDGQRSRRVRRTGPEAVGDRVVGGIIPAPSRLSSVLRVQTGPGESDN